MSGETMGTLAGYLILAAVLVWAFLTADGDSDDEEDEYRRYDDAADELARRRREGQAERERLREISR